MTVRSEHLAAVTRDLPSAGAFPTHPLDALGWSSLTAEMERHRTVGYLSWAVADGEMPATDRQMEEIFERHALLMRHALVLEDETRTLARRLHPHGVVPVLLKGMAAAHLDHEDPSLRVFQDVDLLVRPDDVDSMVADLLLVGCTRDLPPRSEDWDRRFSKDIAITTPRGAEIDLHRTLVPGPFGFTLDLEELHADTVAVDLGGIAVKALCPERRVLAAALALSVGEPQARLAAALDLVGTVRHHGVDTAVVTDLSERWGVGALLAEALGWATDALGEAALPGDLRRWSVDRPTSRRERRIRNVYRSAGGSNTATLLAAPAGMSNWRDRADYLRWLVRPSPAYRHARAASARPREWRTGLSELVRRRP